MSIRIGVDGGKLDEFCRKWRIGELSVFGSVLRDDFGPDSDVDVLVSYDPEAEWSLWDHFAVKEELQQLLGRRVDLLTRRSVERSANRIRRKAILESAESVYVRR